MPNDNANPLRRIAEETWKKMPATTFPLEITYEAGISNHNICVTAIESALRGVVEECAERLDDEFGTDGWVYSNELRFHFLDRSEPTDKEPQQ